MVEEAYREELAARPSTHLYLRALPEDLRAKMDRLSDSEVICSAIREQFDDGFMILPMKNTDELYISHYNKDYGGDHGLFTRHYDGNLRFMPIGAVVRALIYLQSDATYKVVFAKSGVEKALRRATISASSTFTRNCTGSRATTIRMTASAFS